MRALLFAITTLFVGFIGHNTYGAEISNVEVRKGNVYALVDGKETQLTGIYRVETRAPQVDPRLVFTELYVKNLTSTISMTVTLKYRDGETKVVSLMPGQKYSFQNVTNTLSVVGVANVTSTP